MVRQIAHPSDTLPCALKYLKKFSNHQLCFEAILGDGIMNVYYGQLRVY